MRLIDLITETMQPNSIAFEKIMRGYNGTADQSCYTYVGGLLDMLGDQLKFAVVAFYSLPGGDRYTHAAVEEPDGKLIGERRAPWHFRDANGFCIRPDMMRWAIPVMDVLNWLNSAQANKEPA